MITNAAGISIRLSYPRKFVKIVMAKFADKELVGIEIGIDRGEHSKDILKRLNIKKLYLIDPYDDFDNYPGTESAEKKCHKRLEKYQDKIIFIRKLSDDAIEDIKEKVDFVYIDGSHTHQQTLKDIKNYSKLLKEDGLIGGHDICGHRGVTEAVIQYCYENNVSPTFFIDDWTIDKSEGRKIKHDSSSP